MDEPEPYFGRTFSRAKNAEARLRISISIACTRFSRRNLTSSARSSRDKTSLWPSSTSAWCIHRRRQVSLIDRSLAICAIGFSRSLASSTARCRNFGDLGAGIWTSSQGDHPLKLGVRKPQDRSGAGLAAFAVVALVALVWTFVDVRRDGRWVRTVLVWVAVGVLLALLSAMNAQGWTVRPDVEVLLQDIWGFLGFLSCLAAVPAGLGVSAGYAVHENRSRST